MRRAVRGRGPQLHAHPAAWLAGDDRGPRTHPAPRLSRRELAALPRGELLRYNDARKVWHANLGPFKTPQLLDLHDGLAEIVESNRQDGDKNKPAALVDSYPGLGKTTAVLDYARHYYLEQIELRGDSTPGGHRRVPVIYIALTGSTQIRGLNEAICRFYGLPVSGNADTLAARAGRSGCRSRSGGRGERCWRIWPCGGGAGSSR